MNDLIKFASAKALEKLLPKDFKPTVGIHEIATTFTIDVNGIIDKRQDEEYTPTVDIPLISTMAALLYRMGFQREAAIKLLTDAMSHAIINESSADDQIAERVVQIKEAISHVQKITAELPKKVRAGKTMVKAVAVIHE